MKNVLPKLNKYWTIETLRSFDGKAIRYGYYHKGTKPVSRIVIFANGRSEWIEKYDFLPELLELPEDTAFVTWDHRGQGASDGERASIDSYDTFAQDMAAILNEVSANKTYAVIAHSMGGLISMYATLTQKIAPQCISLSAPLFLLPEAPMKRSVARRIAKALNRRPFLHWHTGAGNYDRSTFARNPLTHSAEAYERLRHAPYKIPSPTFSWVNASFHATDTIFEQDLIKNLNCPVLVMGGSNETVVDPRGFSRWSQIAEQFSPSPVRFESIAGARHELFNEIPRYQKQAIALTRQWLNQHFFAKAEIDAYEAET